MSSEKEYIAQREKQAERLSGLFRKAWLDHPIKKGKIVFSTFEGDGGFCCNPRYIAEELHRRNPDYEMVWLVKDTKKEFPSYIHVYEYNERNIVYHLSTAQVWIDNYRKPLGTIKRKGQFYLQTWHASIGFKAVGLYRGELFPEIAKIVSMADSSLADYFISNSDYCDQVYPKKLLYDGPTIRTGSPRVDCLINNREELQRIIRTRYGLSDNTKIVLFAPTFRGGNQKGKKQVLADASNIDFGLLITKLKKKYGGDWKIFMRLHPQLAAQLSRMPTTERNNAFVDVSQASDISEIMAACDLVLTDYSSCAFDALFAHIPVLLFADDVEEYIRNRGKFMWKREELPFMLAENNEELMKNIELFDTNIYVEHANMFMNAHGIVEDGHASERVADMIIQAINQV